MTQPVNRVTKWSDEQYKERRLQNHSIALLVFFFYTGGVLLLWSIDAFEGFKRCRESPFLFTGFTLWGAVATAAACFLWNAHKKSPWRAGIGKVTPSFVPPPPVTPKEVEPETVILTPERRFPEFVGCLREVEPESSRLSHSEGFTSQRGVVTSRCCGHSTLSNSTERLQNEEAAKEE